ncbi:protein TolR [Lysobacter yangpyeongensis]|uniref:Tol-Pal system protein TolR n=1 Tax=Lysobacter yangpyeongensis TaxID=346182 RepID=A0ABW0SPK6_9GAMM
MTALSMRRHRKRKLKAEINVVPYIDVMLVLLVIFMVTAPLLTLGVDVDLPQTNAKSINPKEDTIVVRVDPNGSYALVTKDDPTPRSMTPKMLEARVRAIVSQNKDASFLVAARGEGKYQDVMDAMALLQRANVKKIGLMSDPKSTSGTGTRR